MNIHPPKIEIPPDDPYRNDIFKDRKEFGESITSLLKSVDDSVVLSVNAPWGEGKTTFARMWMADLKRQKIAHIYFDAYQHDHCEDPFIAFTAEIIDLVDRHFKGIEGIKKLKKEFLSSAARVGGKLFETFARLGAKVLTNNILDAAAIEELSTIKDDLSDKAGSLLERAVNAGLKKYVKEKDDEAHFREQLSDLGRAIKKHQSLPLLIIIDELDRCRPDFAMNLIERVKHLFTTEGVAFVLLCNSNQLENYVRTVYGTGIDARNYLRKFFTIATDLPKEIVDDNKNAFDVFSRSLYSHYGIGNLQQKSYPTVLFQRYNFSLREIEQYLQLLGISMSQEPRYEMSFDCVLVLLAVIKMRSRRLFDNLAIGSVTYHDLLKEAQLVGTEKIENWYFDWAFLHEMLKFCLLPKDEFEKLPDDSSAKAISLNHPGHWLVDHRNQIIPRFCKKLNRFSFEMPK